MFPVGERSSQRTGGDGGFALGEVCPHLLRAHCWVFQRCEDLIEQSVLLSHGFLIGIPLLPKMCSAPQASAHGALAHYQTHTRVRAKSFSCARLFVTLWTIACHAPLSM